MVGIGRTCPANKPHGTSLSPYLWRLDVLSWRLDVVSWRLDGLSWRLDMLLEPLDLEAYLWNTSGAKWVVKI